MEFQKRIKALGIDPARANFASLEGYIVARVVAEGLRRAHERPINANGERLHHPDQQRSRERATQRTHAADHNDDENNRADGLRHAGLSNERVATDHARKPRQSTTTRKHHGEYARHVVAERFGGVRVCERGLNDKSDARFLEQQEQTREHADGNQHHEPAIGRKI